MCLCTIDLGSGFVWCYLVYHIIKIMYYYTHTDILFCIYVCVVLALLLNVPGIRVSIFSTGKRASGSLLQIILDFLQKVPGGRDRLLKTNQEELFLACAGSGKKGGSTRASVEKIAEAGDRISKCYSYPSSVRKVYSFFEVYAYYTTFDRFLC